MPLETCRNAAALEMLKLIWPIHHRPGAAYDDAVTERAFRDAFVLANEWERIGALRPEELAKVGIPKQEQQSTPQQPAADAVVEGEKL